MLLPLLMNLNGMLGQVNSGVKKTRPNKKRRVIFDFEDDGKEIVFSSLMKRIEETPVVVPNPKKLKVRDTGRVDFVPYRSEPKKVEAKAVYGMILEGFQKQQNIERLRKLRKEAEEMEDEEMMQFIQFMLTND